MKCQRRMTRDNLHRTVAIVFALVGIIYFALISLSVYADSPVGTITIFGYNGTVVTGSRNVFLNLSYSAPTHGIRDCRWANDAAGNLNNYAYEGCRTVKAWILSEGYGDKTVYFQMRDYNDDTTIISDTISYTYLQDYTAPTPPVVYDGFESEDIDWWNSNTTLYAHWFNATEDISTLYYKYRIYNNSVCYAGDCGWTDVSTNTYAIADNLVLEEGNNYTFEVAAYNPFSLNATARSDNVTIDLTDPSVPIVTSLSHPSQTTPYNSSVVLFNWTASDPVSNGVSSGIGGYSYLIDRHPGTAPDNTVEARYWETLAEMHIGSYNQTLKTNSTGRAYAVFSQLHYNISVNDSLKVSVALAEQESDYDDPMDVKVYLIGVPDGTDINSFNMEASAISDVVGIRSDIMYVEDMTDAWTYHFDLTANDTADDNTDDVYVVVAGYTSDDDNRNLLAIAGTTTAALVDSSTRNFACDETKVGIPACPENTNTLDYAIEVKREDSGDEYNTQYEYLGDGKYYFHVKAQDRAGNWGDTSHYGFIVAAGGVSSLIYSPVDGEVIPSDGNFVNISVKVSLSGNASVYVVAEQPGGGRYTSPAQIGNRTVEFENVTLERGRNTLYAVTNTSAGAVSQSPSISVWVSASPEPATNKTLKVSYPGCASSGRDYLCYKTQSGYYFGAASEYQGVVGSSVQADTSENRILIFASKEFNAGAAEAELADQIFLDAVNPSFGFELKPEDYIIRQELRYYDMTLGGNFLVPPGTYNLQLRKSGTTQEGKMNITIYIE